MKRRLFTILSAVSLLVCVATAFLWVRSFHGFSAWLYVGAHRHFSVTAANGAVILQSATEFHLENAGIVTGFRSGHFPEFLGGDSDDARDLPVWLLTASYSNRTPPWLSWTGVVVGDGPHTPDYPPDFRQTVVTVPFGYWVALFALMPLLAVLYLFRRWLERVMNFRDDFIVQLGWQGSLTQAMCRTMNGILSLRI